MKNTWKSTWGLLGPELLPNARRTRTLGLGASVRHFNDLAVPGLGGVWYGKQLLLATLGVAVAEQARRQGANVQNIEVANAIEALACWLAFKKNGWKSDSRLRGNSKLQGKDDFSFSRVRQRNFYVTQPMRMATVQALPALGFVESDGVRFNAFRCSKKGMDFITMASGSSRPYNRAVIDHLTEWAQMKDDRVDTDALRQVLSPLTPLSKDAIPLLSERLIQGGNDTSEDKTRRDYALKWVESLQTNKTTWEEKPTMISKDHWHDLHAGALFFKAREAAIAFLDALEAHIGNKTDGQLHSLQTEIPDALSELLDRLKNAANEFRETKHSDEDADKFCRECVHEDQSEVLSCLVKRDGQVLRLVGDEIKPGPAFRGSPPPANQADADNEDQETPQAGEEDLSLPEGISYRVRNLYLLNLDMHGKLDGWLKQGSEGSEA